MFYAVKMKIFVSYTQWRTEGVLGWWWVVNISTQFKCSSVQIFSAIFPEFFLKIQTPFKIFLFNTHFDSALDTVLLILKEIISQA